MVFSSHLFVFYFLPLTLAVYYCLPRRARHLALTVLSYGFYGWANPAFMGLMMASTVVDYACARWMVSGRGRDEDGGLPLLPGTGSAQSRLLRTRSQRWAVAISVATNLSLLGFFKYFNFALGNYDAVVTWLGFEGPDTSSVMRVVLPLGISFYTFQSMSYTIDVYRGRARALTNFIDFACYVSLFPQLVAGPIIRFSEIADQLAERTHTLEKLARGTAFFSLGMAKKVLLANPCGKVADTVFEAASATPLDAWYGTLAYAFQIYFDFSGYSDMAIGLGLLLGFVFPKNFDSPYRAESITDFWRRWHQSLSRWLRDYLYLPLGGNRRGRIRTYANLALVMLLGGLWHGAAWNFVLWGAFHGVLLAAERMRGKTSLFAPLPVAVCRAGTFLLVLFSWVLFRAADLGVARERLAEMLFLRSPEPAAALLGGLIHQPYYLVTVALAAAVAWLAPQTWEWTRRLTWAKALACAVLLWTALVVLNTQAYNPFIYFIF